MSTPAPAELLLGPLLRHVDDTRATIWVETDRPAEVVVTAGERRASARTWGVHGHHYAILVVTGLTPGSTTPYEVHLDGEPRWPEPASPFPPSTIRTLHPDGGLRLAFGSCRRSEPLDAAGTKAFGADALVQMAAQMAEDPTGRERPWPDALLFVGDQIYADEPSAALTARLAATHDDASRGSAEGEVGNFEEYTWLYREAWTPAPVRWLLSTVATSMLLDDHDLRDDWNTSLAWREEVAALPWWRDRVLGAFGSYFVHQHLGNLSPEGLAADPVLRALQEAPDDAARDRVLDDFAWRADAEPTSARWSFSRDFRSGHSATSPDATDTGAGDTGAGNTGAGNTGAGDAAGTDGEGTSGAASRSGHGTVRLVAIDSRCSRVLDPEHRAILDDHEWRWVSERATEAPADGHVDHLLLASTLPVLMMHGFADVEGWDERLARPHTGPLSRWRNRLGERLRQGVDLEHWPAFRTSLDALVELMGDVVRAPRPPASLLLLGGDVHCSYIAGAQLQGVDHPGTAVHQLVMSPFRNPLHQALRWANAAVELPPVRAFCRGLARMTGVTLPAIRYEVDAGPWFENGVMTLVFDGDRADVEVEHYRVEADGTVMRRTQRRRLTA